MQMTKQSHTNIAVKSSQLNVVQQETVPCQNNFNESTRLHCYDNDKCCQFHQQTGSALECHGNDHHDNMIGIGTK